MSSTPSYDLNAIKRAFSDVSALRMTGSARRALLNWGLVMKRWLLPYRR